MENHQTPNDMSDKEIWKDINGYEGYYQVSNLGRVKSMNRVINKKDGKILTLKERILKPNLGVRGYYKVCFHKDGKIKFYTVHKLVAIAFLNHTPCGLERVVDHIDNNRLNNNVDNLQIVSSRFNSSKHRKTVTSKHVGVSYSRKYKKWVSAIHINGKHKFLGHFTKEEDASKAYQYRLKKHQEALNLLKQRKG